MVRIGRIASVRGILLSAVVMALSAPFAANGQDVPAASGVVPSVIGLPAKDAKAALVAAGLAPKFELGTEAGPGTDALTVYAQEPKSGASVRRGAEVKVTISTRPGAAGGQAKPSMLGQLSRVRPARTLVRHSEIIEPRSGQLLMTATDMVVPAGPITLELTRSLQSEPGKPGLLGARWKLNWESTLSQSGGQAFLREADHTVYFTLDESTEQYVAPSGDYVVFEANRSVRVTPDGRREIFDRRGRLVERLEPSNNRIVLKYNSRGVLSRIDGPDQSFVRFTIDSTGRLTRAESSSGDRVEYVYGPQPPSPDRAADEWCVEYGYDASGGSCECDVPSRARSGSPTMPRRE